MPEIFVPKSAPELPEGVDAQGVAWVTVYHSGLGVQHHIPVDALDGFRESGWELVLPQKGDPIKAGQIIGLSAPQSSNDQSAAVDNDDDTPNVGESEQ